MNFFTPKKNTEDADDQELLAAYRKNGDLVVLGKLFEKQVSLIYGVCLKYLSDEEKAKDAVMGIFEELVEKAKKHDIKQFRSWLYVLTKNHCLMQLRSGKKAELVNLDDFMEFLPVLHPDSSDREAAMVALERCLDGLSLAQKQSIELFYFKEQCYKEIAVTTGYNLNEIKSYIQNGRRNLKICLEKERE